MNGAVRGTALIAAIVCATAAIGAGPAGAGGGDPLPKTVHVRGTQQAVDGSSDFFTVRSDPGRAGLVGDWAITHRFSQSFRSPFFFETGTEWFDGCLDLNGDNACHSEPTGSMTFNYASWVKFDPALLPDVFSELAGGCVHPVTGGSGAFAGARGLLTMRDRPVGDTIETTYRGSLTLGSRTSGFAAGVPAAPEVSAAANAEVSPTSEAAGPPAPAAQHQGC
jgi:large exoprotein involved in heme utilization and adhesion